MSTPSSGLSPGPSLELSDGLLLHKKKYKLLLKVPFAGVPSLSITDTFREACLNSKCILVSGQDATCPRCGPVVRLIPQIEESIVPAANGVEIQMGCKIVARCSSTRKHIGIPLALVTKVGGLIISTQPFTVMSHHKRIAKNDFSPSSPVTHMDSDDSPSPSTRVNAEQQPGTQATEPLPSTRTAQLTVIPVPTGKSNQTISGGGGGIGRLVDQGIVRYLDLMSLTDGRRPPLPIPRDLFYDQSRVVVRLFRLALTEENYHIGFQSIVEQVKTTTAKTNLQIGIRREGPILITITAFSTVLEAVTSFHLVNAMFRNFPNNWLNRDLITSRLVQPLLYWSCF